MKLEVFIYPYAPELADLPFRLTGIGGSSWQSRVSRPEGYVWNQILFCTDGCGVLEYGGHREEIYAGSFIFLPHDVPHEYYPVTERWEMLWITFDGKGSDETLALLGLDKITVTHTADIAPMEALFEKMLNSQRTDIIYSGYTCSGLVYEFVLGFRRLITTDADRTRSRRLSLLMPALKYMHDHFAEDISMSYLAELTGVTPQHFCRLFRSTMNTRPNDHLTELRLENARRLLLDSTLSVAEIAAQCGFRDAGYFSTVFRRRTNVSPVTYRRNRNVYSNPTF